MPEMKRYLVSSIILLIVLGLLLPNSFAEGKLIDITKHYQLKNWTDYLVTEVVEGGIPENLYKRVLIIDDEEKFEWFSEFLYKSQVNEQDLVTRAEFATIIKQIYEFRKGFRSSFKDTENHVADSDIDTLEQKNIIDASEYGGYFEPDKNITRIEIAKIIVRAMRKDKIAKDKINLDTGFSDNMQIKAEDRGYVIVANEYGIISGYLDNTFKPNNLVSRHDVGKIISNLYNYMLTEKVEIVPYAKKVTEEASEVQTDGITEEEIPIPQLSNGIIENNLGHFYIQLTNMDKYLDEDYFVKIVCVSHENSNIFYRERTCDYYNRTQWRKISELPDDLIRWEPDGGHLIGPGESYRINKTQKHIYDIYIKKGDKITKVQHTVDYKELKRSFLKRLGIL